MLKRPSNPVQQDRLLPFVGDGKIEERLQCPVVTTFNVFPICWLRPAIKVPQIVPIEPWGRVARGSLDLARPYPESQSWISRLPFHTGANTTSGILLDDRGEISPGIMRNHHGFRHF